MPDLPRPALQRVAGNPPSNEAPKPATPPKTPPGLPPEAAAIYEATRGYDPRHEDDRTEKPS